MDNIIGLAVPLFALILFGFGAGKIMSGDRRGLEWLNILTVYFALPALIFRVVSDAPIEQLTNWAYVGATTLSTYIVFTLMFVVAVVVGRVGVAGAALRASAASYSNVGYMGVPLAAAVFGEAGALPATLILCFDSLLQFTLVPILLAAGRREEGYAAIVHSVRSIALNPLILALVLGAAVAASGIEKPQILDRTVGYLAGAAAPAALFAIGVTLARQRLVQIDWDMPVIVLVKLVIHPIVAIIMLLAVGGFEPLWIYVAILLAGLPTAANVYVMASQFDVYTEGTCNAILLTTVISLATVLGIVGLIEGGYLPTMAADVFL